MNKHCYAVFIWDWLKGIHKTIESAEKQKKILQSNNPGARVWIDRVTYYEDYQ